MNGVTPFFDIPPSGQNAAYKLTAGEKLRFDQARINCLKKWNPRLVIISTFWAARNDRQTTALLEFLGQQGLRVLLIEDPPILDSGDLNVMQLLAKQGVKPTGGKKHFWPHVISTDEKGRQLVRELAAKYNHVEFLPTYDLYTSDSGALVLDGKSVIYLDDDHLLQAGSHKIIPRLREKIAEIFGKR